MTRPQPALLTHHIACLEVFREKTGGSVQPTMAAGHSLGEYSALVAANSLTFETALRLVQKRGELMGEHGEGEMTAFMMAVDEIQPLAEQFKCAISACNQPLQTVVGGSSEDLGALEAHVAEAFPRKGCIPYVLHGHGG
jgi:[acyl-carrier-protein] S-malonyltransferase